MNLMSSHLSSIKNRIVMVIMVMGVMLNSCQKEKLNIPGNVGTIRFAANSYTIENNTIDPLIVVLPLSLPIEQESTAIITVDPTSTISASEYTITPAIPAAGITLNLAKGATETSFQVSSLNNFEGDKTLVLKVSSAGSGLTVSNTNAVTTIVIKGNPIILPELKTSESSVAFGPTITNTTSPSKSYVFTGVKLTADVSVTASANFLVSLDDVTFTSSLTIPVVVANTAPITVYTRFVANTGANTTVNGTITHSSGTLPDAIVTLSGVEYGVAASGVLLKNENFSYGATDNYLASNATGGTPARTGVGGANWKFFSAGGANAVQYVAGGLSYTGYVGSGIGGALVMQNSSASSEDVSMDFSSQSSGVIYAAQLINFASAPTTADFFYSFGDGVAGATPVYYNRFYAKANGSQLSLGLSRNASTTPAYSATNLEYGTTYLVVTKYEFATGNSSMYILTGAPTAIEPPTPNVISTGGAGDPSAMTRIVVRQSTNSPLKPTIDGIRVATSWKQAVGL